MHAFTTESERRNQPPTTTSQNASTYLHKLPPQRRPLRPQRRRQPPARQGPTVGYQGPQRPHSGGARLGEQEAGATEGWLVGCCWGGGEGGLAVAVEGEGAGGQPGGVLRGGEAVEEEAGGGQSGRDKGVGVGALAVGFQ